MARAGKRRDCDRAGARAEERGGEATWLRGVGKGKGSDACCLLLNNNCERNEEPIKHTATAELRLRGSSRRKREVRRERGGGEKGEEGEG